jgi:hypothetical protein
VEKEGSRVCVRNQALPIKSCEGRSNTRAEFSVVLSGLLNGAFPNPGPRPGLLSDVPTGLSGKAVTADGYCRNGVPCFGSFGVEAIRRILVPCERRLRPAVFAAGIEPWLCLKHRSFARSAGGRMMGRMTAMQTWCAEQSMAT